MISAYCVDLAHDGLETRQARGEEQAAKGQGRVEVVTHRQQVACGVGTGDDDNLIAAAAIVLLVVVVTVPVPCRRGSLDLVIAEGAVGVCAGGAHGDDLLLIGGGVCGHGEDLVLDGVQAAHDDGLVDAGVGHPAGGSDKTDKQLAICLGKELDKALGGGANADRTAWVG